VKSVEQRPTLLVRDILMHYLQNPHTIDTIEGIAEWRLLEDIIHRRVRATDGAVAWLVEQGFLERIEGGAIPTLYRLNAAKREEAERFLRDHSDGADE